MSTLDKKQMETLLTELYEKSCKIFGDAFDIEHEVKASYRIKKIENIGSKMFRYYFQKHDIEIHELEMEVNDMHGKFVIPKLRKVKHLHVASESED